MKTGILIATLWVMALQGVAQTFNEKITKEIAFEKKGSNNTLMIFNINGDVKVEGYAGDKVLIEVTKTINGKTEARLQKGKEEIQLGVMDRLRRLMEMSS